MVASTVRLIEATTHTTDTDMSVSLALSLTMSMDQSQWLWTEVSVCAAWKHTFSPFIWGESMDADMSVLMADHPTLDLTGVSVNAMNTDMSVSLA